MHGKKGIGKMAHLKMVHVKMERVKMAQIKKTVKITHLLQITLKELFRDFFQLIYEIQSGY